MTGKPSSPYDGPNWRNDPLEHTPPVRIQGNIRDRRRMHPAELPDHLKAAVRDARMNPRHDHLNDLLNDEPPDDRKTDTA